jgi:lysozyme family protein
MSLDTIIDNIISNEGGYVNDSSDLGGETKYGITVLTAKANGYYGNMKDLPLSLARQIYANKYYYEPKFDKVAVLSESIAAELTDTAVNMGVEISKGFLQSSLNLFNRQEKDYKDIPEDRSIGPITLAALGSFLSKRGKEGEQVMVRTLNIMQGARYIEITKARVANEEFLWGWLKNRVAV